MDVDLLRPGTVPIAPDTILWFEFLLNPQLLLEHLRKPSPDPSAIDLITKFFDVINESLKIQNETDSGEINNINTDISTEKHKHSNKNIALKLLSLKIAAFMKWDLSQIRLLPFKTQMALIQDILYFTNDRTLVEIPLVDNKWSNLQHLFALLMYHRWMLNVTMNRITSNWQLKVGSVDISPCEESVICTLENVNNTVKFLENCLEWENIPSMPKFECFEMPTERNENINFDWSKSENISREALVAQICYELGTYFFYREEYKLATERFQRCSESFRAIKSTDGFLTFDKDILEVYLKACCGPFEPFNSSIVNNYEDISGILQKDNVKREIPLTYRMNLELDIQGAKSSESFCVARDLLPQIKALNLVRCILDRKPTHQYHITLSKNPDALIRAIQSTWNNFSLQDKNTIKQFLMEHIIKNDGTAMLSQIQSNPVLGGVFDACDMKYMRSFEEEINIPSILLEGSNGLELFKKKWDVCGGKRELKLLEQRLITSYDPQDVRELLTMTSLNNTRISVWNINPLWELPIPLQSVLKSLSRGFLQDFAYVMLAKSKEQMLASNWDLSLNLIRTLEKELQLNSGSNIAKLGQMIKWEILLIQIVQLLHEWPKSTIDKNALASSCEHCLQSNETVLPRTEIAEHCVICLLNLGKWDFLMNFDKRRSSSEIASALAYTCQEWVKFKMKEEQDIRRGIDLKKMPPPQLPKILWDIVLPTFTTYPKRGNQGSAYQDSQLTNLRASVSSFFANLRDPTAFSVIISMLTRFYNVLRDMSKADQQIIVEGVDWWPSGVNNPQPYNVKGVAELLPQITLKALKYYPNNIKWLRLMGDVNLVKDHYQIALKYYLQSLLIQTDYFNIPVRHDDDLYLRLIQCSTSLNCFTQAAVLYQFLEKPNYKQAFYYLRESKMGNDAVDAYYHCFWDINILEYLINLHHHRGEFQRKKCAIQVMGLLEINSSNNEEIQREASNSRKATFLRAICKQYVFN